MQLKRTSLFLLLLPLTLTTPTRTIDPITGSLAAAAIGAVIGATGYLAYDYTHYNSEQNCRNAINDLSRKMHEPNIYAQAADKNSLAPLIPVYKQCIYSNYQQNRSLRIIDNGGTVTDQVFQKAFKYFDGLQEEHTRIKRYKHYSQYAYTSDIQQCQSRNHSRLLFYQRADHRAYDTHVVTQTIANELHNNLRAEIQRSAVSGRYPLHEYIQRIQEPFGIYTTFIQDNNWMNTESSRLIHQATQTIQSVKSSPGYYAEAQEMELDKLRSTYNSLHTTFLQEQRNNDTLRREHADLVTRNRAYFHVVQELKNIHYCYECQLHTAGYFNSHAHYTLYQTHYSYPHNNLYAQQNYGYMDTQRMEIERLGVAINSLKYSLSQLQHENSNLRRENSDLSSANRRLKQVIDELKTIHYCYACESHTRTYLYNY